MTNETIVTGAIIAAAGRSERSGAIDKLWAPLAGRPLIAWTLAAFEACSAIDRIVLVVAADAVGPAEALVSDQGFSKVAHVITGGTTRQASVRTGIDTLAGCDLVAVHDGARPLVTPELIATTVAAARETGAACLAIPAQDTPKEVAGDRIVRTLDRSRLWLAQTPQAFRYDLLLAAHERSEGGSTDDARLIEALGLDVRVILGSPLNLKVTTPDDLKLAEALLAAR